MTQFWIVAALLVLVSMALILVPMARRGRSTQDISDRESNIAYFKEQEAELKTQVEQGLLTEEDAESIRLELEKKLLSDVEVSGTDSTFTTDGNFGLAMVLALLIPVLAVPLYMHLGAQTEIKVTEMLMEPGTSPQEMLTALEDWSEKRPDNGQALYMLGGRYMASGQMEKAVDAYRKLYEVTEGSAQAAAQLAQALFLAQQNTVNDEVRRLYKEALAQDEMNGTALGLSGIDSFEQEDYKGAIVAWSRALSVENDLAARDSLTAGISKARKLLGETVAEVRVNVTLAPELKGLPGTARVIVFARESGQRKPPIAAIPMQVSDLPREVVLDDNATMMMGGGSLKDLEALDVVARISLSGDVSKSDYEAEVRAVKLKDQSVVQLMISPAG